ncbi:type 1 glutamine amidotransferase [Gleimia hominis]|uniref:type 1 glutamine amidotransferase n=1 Tax=Gleimia hominis TaxID=595468 RepID=UPI000C7FF9F6|nr:glutamine amidotransferase [Gleimia hominis]WIK64464.1 glutamine amidotransferase [Gleimia hominis]
MGLRICVLLPEVLGTYGDGGNALVLAQRARWRNVDAEIVKVSHGESIPTEVDLFTIGGGEDTAQAIAAEYLRKNNVFFEMLESKIPVLAICAGMQILGRSYTDAQGREVEGAGVLDCVTLPGGKRAIGELVSTPLLPGLTEPLTGFENHGGVTEIGVNARPLGKVLSGVGNGGGSAADRVEGVVQGSVIATYMHGPVLARNPQFADYLLTKAGVDCSAELEMPHVDRLRKERLKNQLGAA